MRRPHEVTTRLRNLLRDYEICGRQRPSDAGDVDDDVRGGNCGSVVVEDQEGLPVEGSRARGCFKYVGLQATRRGA